MRDKLLITVCLFFIEFVFEITLLFCNTVTFYGHANRARVLLLLLKF